MKFIVFELHLKQNIWIYENMQLWEIEDYRWALTIDKKCQIYESIYAVIDALAVVGFHATFRYPKEMYDVNPMNKCG